MNMAGILMQSSNVKITLLLVIQRTQFIHQNRLRVFIVIPILLLSRHTLLAFIISTELPTKERILRIKLVVRQMSNLQY